MRALLIFFCLCIGFGLSAQDLTKPVFRVSEGNREFIDDATRNALIVELPEMKERDVERLWKDYIGKFGGKTKKMRDIKGYFTDDTEIYSIGGINKLDVYARVEDDRSQTTLTAWFDMNDGMLRSDTQPEAYKAAVSFLQDFALEVKISEVQEKLDEEEKNLKDLEKAMDRLKRDNDDYHKTIKDAREKIAKAEQDIEQNERDQVSTTERIGEQKEKVSQVRERLNYLKK